MNIFKMKLQSNEPGVKFAFYLACIFHRYNVHSSLTVSKLRCEWYVEKGQEKQRKVSFLQWFDKRSRDVCTKVIILRT